jgi:hypothetical protein
MGGVDRPQNKLEALRDDIMREVGKDAVPSETLCAVRDILIDFMSKNEVMHVHEFKPCGRRWAVDWDFPEQVESVEIIVPRKPMPGAKGG